MRRLLLWRLSGLRTILWRLWGVWSGLCRLPWLCLSRLCHDRGFGSSLLRPWPWILERRGLLRLDARLLGMESSPQILAPRLLRDSSQTVLRRENGNFRGTARTRPFGRLWYDMPDNAIGYAMRSNRSH